MNKRNILPQSSRSSLDFIWDAWCIASIIGIWPRYIEPRLLSTTRLKVPIRDLPSSLNGLKILQFSDLHWGPDRSPMFLNKLIQKVEVLQPDVIVFTGDLLSYSILSEDEALQDFLSAFHAPYGCYAILGNHDYGEYVSVDQAGDYAISKKTDSPLTKGWKRLLSNITLTKKINPEVHQVPLHSDLVALLEKTPFKLLHNSTTLIPIKDSYLNICGLGEHMLGRCLPEEAFDGYDARYPGIVLLHNPDGLSALQDFPGDIVLCGHTHGGQVNLPGLVHKFMYLENRHLKRGLKKEGNKWVYINRGTGSVMPFRWFSIPEISLITLE